MSSPTLGYGQFPFGEMIWGFGSPATGSPISGIVLENTVNGVIQECPYIDPNTGDYDIDENGQVVGSSTISNSVYLAVATTLGSTPLPTLGSTFFQIKTINSNIVSQVQNIIYSSLSPFTQTNQITIQSIAVTLPPKGNTVAVQISWTDNTTNGTYLTVVSQ